MMDIPQEGILFESAFKFSAIGIALVSPQGKWLKVNRALTEILGYTEEELLKIDFIQVTHPEDIKADLDLVNELLCGRKESYQMEKRYISKAGKLVYALLSVSLIRETDGNPKFFISQIQDLTEVKAAHANLEANAKLLALGEMAAGIAHEINNPLAAISLHSKALNYLIQQPEIDREMLLTFLSKIDGTINRISSIVTSLQKLSNNGPKNETFKPVPISSVIEDTLGLCKEKFKNHGISLHVLMENDVQVECKALDISHVILNLLNNAFYAIKDYVVKEVILQVEQIKDWVFVSVTDSGLGIQKEIKQKIMEPFFTTKPMGEGTGLGLSISRNIIHLHNGELYLDENSFRTKFVIKLPLVQSYT